MERGATAVGLGNCNGGFVEASVGRGFGSGFAWPAGCWPSRISYMYCSFWKISCGIDCFSSIYFWARNEYLAEIPPHALPVRDLAEAGTGAKEHPSLLQILCHSVCMFEYLQLGYLTSSCKRGIWSISHLSRSWYTPIYVQPAQGEERYSLRVQRDL